MWQVPTFPLEEAQESSHLINQKNLLPVTPGCKAHWNLVFSYAKGSKKLSAWAEPAAFLREMMLDEDFSF